MSKNKENTIVYVYVITDDYQLLSMEVKAKESEKEVNLLFEENNDMTHAFGYYKTIPEQVKSVLRWKTRLNKSYDLISHNYSVFLLPPSQEEVKELINRFVSHKESIVDELEKKTKKALDELDKALKLELLV